MTDIFYKYKKYKQRYRSIINQINGMTGGAGMPCTYGRKCTRGDCWYSHPEGREIEEQGDGYGYGPGHGYGYGPGHGYQHWQEHPQAPVPAATQNCYWDKKCTNPHCQYNHPEGKKIDQTATSVKSKRGKGCTPPAGPGVCELFTNRPPIRQLGDPNIINEVTWVKSHHHSHPQARNIKFCQHNIGPQGTNTPVVEKLSKHDNIVKAKIPGKWSDFMRDHGFRTVQNYLQHKITDRQNLDDIYTFQEVQEEYSCNCIGKEKIDDRDTCTCPDNKRGDGSYIYYNPPREKIPAWLDPQENNDNEFPISFKGNPIPVDLEVDVKGVKYIGIYTRTGFLMFIDEDEEERRIFHGCVVIWRKDKFHLINHIHHPLNSEGVRLTAIDLITGVKVSNPENSLQRRSTPWCVLSNIETNQIYYVMSLHGQIPSKSKGKYQLNDHGECVLVKQGNLKANIINDINNTIIEEIVQTQTQEGHPNYIIGTDYNVNLTNPKTNAFGGQTPEDIVLYDDIYTIFRDGLKRLSLNSVYDNFPSNGNLGGIRPATNDPNFTTNYGLDGNCAFEECVDFILASNNLEVTTFNKEVLNKPVTFPELETLIWLENDFDHSKISVNFLNSIL